MKTPTETEARVILCVLSALAGALVAAAIDTVHHQGNVVCVSREAYAERPRD